jgi:hypothetical protein
LGKLKKNLAGWSGNRSKSRLLKLTTLPTNYSVIGSTKSAYESYGAGKVDISAALQSDRHGESLSDRYAELLSGSYDCTDRIVLNAYFCMEHTAGGFRVWRRTLTGSEETLDNAHLMRMAGRFSRRIHGYAKTESIPLVHCQSVPPILAPLSLVISAVTFRVQRVFQKDCSYLLLLYLVDEVSDMPIGRFSFGTNGVHPESVIFCEVLEIVRIRFHF